MKKIRGKYEKCNQTDQTSTKTCGRSFGAEITSKRKLKKMQSDRSNFNKNMWTILWSQNYKREKTQENAIRPIQKTFSTKEAASKQSIQTLRRQQKSNQLQVSQTLHHFNKYAPPFLIPVQQSSSELYLKGIKKV